jgi:hydroxypyruvate isomerase
MNEEQRAPGRSSSTDRRTWMKTAGAAAVGLAALHETGVDLGDARAAAASGTVIKNGRIKQSLVHWCFEKYWNVEEMIQVAKKLGCESIELIPPKYFPLLKQHGLKCAIGTIDMAPDPPFVKGFNNPKYHDQVFKATRDSIDACSQFGFPSVICFTGMSEGIPAEVGAANCVEAYKKIVGHAEKKNVVLCLEMLNTRDRSHPMKGHPGYQGDHIDYCVDIIKRVGSPHLKLLFDIYHAQIMDGDIIRRLREHREVIGHVHTAGNPGRGELDDKQEIAYKPIMEALIEIGYKGYVGQEFIPTRDPLAGLEQAVALCDV